MNYEITAAVAVVMAIHLAIVYVCLYTLNLSYPMFMIAMIVSGVIGTLLVKAGGLHLKQSIQAALAREEKAKTALADSLMGIVVLIGGGVVSQIMLSQRFGLKGWAGLFLINLLTHAS